MMNLVACLAGCSCNALRNNSRITAHQWGENSVALPTQSELFNLTSRFRWSSPPPLLSGADVTRFFFSVRERVIFLLKNCYVGIFLWSYLVLVSFLGVLVCRFFCFDFFLFALGNSHKLCPVFWLTLVVSFPPIPFPGCPVTGSWLFGGSARHSWWLVVTSLQISGTYTLQVSFNFLPNPRDLWFVICDLGTLGTGDLWIGDLGTYDCDFGALGICDLRPLLT